MYNVGDRIVFKTVEEVKKFGVDPKGNIDLTKIGFAPEMTKFLGKEAVISEVVDDDITCGGTYRIKGSLFYFIGDVIKGYAENHDITVIVKCHDGLKVIPTDIVEMHVLNGSIKLIAINGNGEKETYEIPKESYKSIKIKGEY